ncbi:MAG: CRISPR-associated protein Cas5h [Geotoga sp.]|nr:CRISPR-associated protein Cas5h [Geotoga sp.]
MKILVFDLIGKAAHFRKFYTNSSSLSYYFPPKTTLAGLIAGILGFERDSYYEYFGDKAKIGVKLVTPVRKKINTVNYLMIKKGESKNLSYFRGLRNRTLVPVEFVFPKSTENLIYRVYFSHEDESLNEKLKERLKNKKFVYPPYLGITELLANINYIGEFEVDQITEYKLEVSTVLKTEFFKKILKLDNIQRDRVPESFGKDREIKKISDYVFSPDGINISIEKSENANFYFLKEEDEIISFL